MPSFSTNCIHIFSILTKCLYQEYNSTQISIATALHLNLSCITMFQILLNNWFDSTIKLIITQQRFHFLQFVCILFSRMLYSDTKNFLTIIILIYQLHMSYSCISYYCSHITVWTVAQTVLTATFNSYWNRQISTPSPTKSIPLNQSTKKSAQLITSARGPPIPILVEIHSLGASGQMGEI